MMLKERSEAVLSSHEHKKGGTLKPSVPHHTLPAANHVRRVPFRSKPTGLAGPSGNGFRRFRGSGFLRLLLCGGFLLFTDRGADHRDVVSLDALGLGFEGRMEGISAQAVALLVMNDE